MQGKNKGKIAMKISELVKDAVEECGCKLWDVEYVREGTDYTLTIYIDKPDGISLDDCEMVNDAVEPIIDKEDPIEGSYYLEVSSPGLERELKTPEHIKAFLGQRVLVKLYAPQDGKKVFDGNIDDFDEEKSEITLDVSGASVKLKTEDCASIKTVCEF